MKKVTMDDALASTGPSHLCTAWHGASLSPGVGVCWPGTRKVFFGHRPRRRLRMGCDPLYKNKGPTESRGTMIRESWNRGFRDGLRAGWRSNGGVNVEWRKLARARAAQPGARVENRVR